MIPSRAKTAAPPATLRLFDLGCASLAAGREHNEDHAEVHRLTSGVLAIVADGMGGGDIGSTMSKQAVQAAVESLRDATNEEPLILIEEAFTLANRLILNLMQINPLRFSRSGSTLVCALVQVQNSQVTAHIGNLGDSRAYLLQPGRLLRQISRDHSYAEYLRSQGLTGELAEQDPQSRRLTYSLGMNLDIRQVPDFYIRQRLETGDIVLLCSDGLSNVMDEQELTTILRSLPAQRAADTLVRRAWEQKKTTDNASAVVIRYGSPPPPSRAWMVGGGIFILVLLLGLLLWGTGVLSKISLSSLSATKGSAPVTVTGGIATITALPVATSSILQETATLLPGLATSTRNPTPTNTPTSTPTPTRTRRPTVTPTKAILVSSPTNLQPTQLPPVTITISPEVGNTVAAATPPPVPTEQYQPPTDAPEPPPTESPPTESPPTESPPPPPTPPVEQPAPTPQP